MIEFPPELVGRAKRGDALALEELCHRMLAFVNGVLARAGATAEEREEITQETALRVLRALDTLRDDSRLAGLIVVCARHAWFDYLRRKTKQARLKYVPTNTLADVCVQGGDPQDLATLESSVIDAVERMGEEFSALFVLWRFQRLTARELAEILGVSVSTVKNWKRRLMERLAAVVYGESENE